MTARTYNYSDAIGMLVRHLIRSAYGMTDGAVRPANQAHPTGKPDVEFATVLILDDEGQIEAATRRTINDTSTVGSTKVLETMDVYHEFTASVQFFRHSTPPADGVGLVPPGMGAFDKASRLQSVLMLSPNMELMESLGLMFLGASPARNLAGLVNGAIWEDRGSVDLYFGCSTAESVLLDTIASAEILLKAQWPSGHVDSQTIEVPS